MVSSSSSSPKKKKTMKIPQIKQTLFKKPHSSSCYSGATSFIKRQETVFKKAKELSILCGIQVCVICYGPNGELKTWPEDREEVKAIAQRYSGLSETKRRKKSVDLHHFVKQIKKDDSKKKNKKEKKVRRVSKVNYPVWDPRFDNYSVEQLTGLNQSLERNLTRIQHRIHAVVEAQRQRKIQYTNTANQELMMTNTMNYLPQRSNQVSMFLFNNGNGTFSQIPVPASALNPAQSLAPVPPELMIYPNSGVGNYSGSLGVQGTGINGFQNMNNMLTYNNSVNDFSELTGQNSGVESFCGLLEAHDYGINEADNTNMYRCNNFNVDDYSGLLGVQGTGTNGLQSMNMYDYNYNSSINANGLSHQLVQLPTQQQYRGFN